MTSERPTARFLPQQIPEVLLIEPVVHRDDRGFFLETYSQEVFDAAGLPRFVQDNLSSSARHTLRGLHAQWRRPQGKLVRVLEGTIYDVAVDLRRDAPTFGQWVGLTLTADALSQVYIPPGFAHGFCVCSPRALVAYKTTQPHDPGGELAVRWDDPALGISWPCRQPQLSARDAAAPRLAELHAQLPTVATAADVLGCGPS